MAKAYVFIKTRTHPQPDGPGAQQGDVIEILPIDNRCVSGKKVFQSFLPVVVKDLKIPCGDGVQGAAGPWAYTDDGPAYSCGKCPYNDLADCDKVKYLKAIWTGGDILNPPTVIKKRMYKVNVTTVTALFPVASIVFKTNKTDQEILAVKTFIVSNEKPKTIVELKK